MPRNQRLLISLACFLILLLAGGWWAASGPVELSGLQRMLISGIVALLASACLFQWMFQRDSAETQKEDLLQPDPSDLVTHMGHEIRTPLSGILGVMHLLRRTRLDANQQRYVETASKSATMLLNIINDVIARARMDTGWLPIESEFLEIEELMEDVTSILTPEASAKGLQLVCDVDPELPQRIKGDALRLRQVLNNFLHNAIKYTQHGVIAVYALRHEDGIEVGVEDSGVGIEAEKCAHLQQPASEFDDTESTGGSFGLGLDNSRKLIEAMGAKLLIDSEPGKGSRFYFQIEGGDEPGESYDWRPPKAFQDLSISILGSVELRGRSIARTLSYWRVGKVLSVDFDVDASAEIPQLDPCDVLIIDQGQSEQAVNELIQRLRNNSAWRPTFFIHLVPQDRVGRGGEADLRLYKPLSNSRLYAGLLDTVYKRAFNAEFDGARASEQDDATSILAYRRILLVEDNDINRMIALEMLEETGLLVDVANNGAEAVEQVQRVNYDLILMDILMPVMDGYDATRAIRALGGKYASIPVIAITAHAIEGDGSKSLEAGMNYHVTKPFDPDSLITVITRFIEEQSQASDSAPK